MVVRRGNLKGSFFEDPQKAQDLLRGDDLFVAGEFTKYPTFIDSRTGGASGLASGDLIEEPVGMIEFIAREYGGLVDANIDTSNLAGGFDKAYTDTSGFTFAGLIDNEIGWVAAINDLAQQCKARLYFSNEGKLSISIYDSSANFTQSGTGIPKETGSTDGSSDVYIERDINIIVNATNNLFTMVEDIAGSTSVNDITLTNANYSGLDLAVELATKLTAGTTEGITYTGTYNTSTQKITLTGDIGKTFTTDTPNILMTAGAITGFTSPPTASTSITSPVAIKPNTPTEKYNNHLIIRGSFQYQRTPIEDITNEVYINYFYNYGANKFQKTTFITDTNSDDGAGTRDQNTTAPNDRESIASTSKSNYKKTRKLTFNAPFIREDATAVLLRNHFFDLLVDFRGVVSFTTFYTTLHLQLGDIINIQHPFLENIVTSMVTKKWEVTKLLISLDGMRVSVEAMELV